ncbi:MAG TPA: hypothetical protein VFI63_05080 [Solirubrobacterales bacterium]|nr:hypothetical protein [Solirubrobacterales bacterium]
MSPAPPAAAKAPAVEVLEVTLAGPSERARGGFRVGRADTRLELAGWGLGLDSAVTGVEVLADGEVVGRAAAAGERPDIAAAFPDLPGAGSCGFAVSLEPSGWGESRLAVEVALEDGGRARLGELRVAIR